MVNIYLDGLRPRIKAQWDKLGKTPKKREINYISESELEEELKKSKQERKKYKEEDEKVMDSDKEEKTDVETNQNPDFESAINDLASQIKNFVENDDKQGAISLYSKVQEIYKNTPKEQKAKILGKCIEIQKILNGR